MLLSIESANLDALPPEIAKAFLPVSNQFSYENGIAVCSVAYNSLDFFHDIGMLKYTFEDVQHWNDEWNDLEHNIPDYFPYIYNSYASGVIQGSKEVEELSTGGLTGELELKAYQIFSVVYNRQSQFEDFPMLKDDDGSYLVTALDFYNYGIQVGNYVKCWEIILNHAQTFDKYFVQKSLPISPAEPPLKFQGSNIQYVELLKSLIEANIFLGYTQKEIFEKCNAFFGMKIDHPEKSINDLSKRNYKSETLFLDKLKTTLINYMQK